MIWSTRPGQTTYMLKHIRCVYTLEEAQAFGTLRTWFWCFKKGKWSSDLVSAFFMCEEHAKDTFQWVYTVFLHIYIIGLNSFLQLQARVKSLFSFLVLIRSQKFRYFLTKQTTPTRRDRIFHYTQYQILSHSAVKHDLPKQSMRIP